MELARLWVSIGARSEALDKELKRITKTFDAWGGRIERVGKSMTKFVTLPLLAVGAAAFAAYESVDDALDNIRARTGATGDALKDLGDSFKNVYKDVPASAAQASDAIAGINTRLGLSGPALETMSAQVLNLSRITKSDLNETIAAQTRLFGDWGIATEKQGDALDYVFKLSQKTGVGANRISQLAVWYGAPMRQLGFSFEETTALMAKFEQEGVNTETVLGSMRVGLKNLSRREDEYGEEIEETEAQLAKKREALQKLTDATKTETAGTKLSAAQQERQKEKLRDAAAEVGKLEDKLKQLKTAQADANGKFRDVPDALRDAMQAIKDAKTTAEATSLAMEMFGARAGADMGAAIREGRFELDALIATTKESEDTINKAAKAVMGFPEALQKLRNQVTLALEPLGGALLAAFDNLSPSITKAVERVAELTLRFSELSPETQANIIKFAALTAALGPMLTLVGQLIKAFGHLQEAMAWITASKAGPIGLALGGVYATYKGLEAMARGDVAKQFEDERQQRIAGITAHEGTTEYKRALDEINRDISAKVDAAYKAHRESIKTSPSTWYAPGASAVPELAEGGIVRRPTLALIGEKGPEAVVPLGRGGGLGQIIVYNTWHVTDLPTAKAAAEAQESQLTRILRERAVMA